MQNIAELTGCLGCALTSVCDFWFKCNNFAIAVCGFGFQWYVNRAMVNCYRNGDLSIRILWLLVIILSTGCTHSQFVNESYPRWGKEYRIPESETDPELVQTDSLMLRVMKPEHNTASACILLVHGMNEYIGRYSEVARYFSRHHVVAGFDYYAHGLSNTVLRQADRAQQAGSNKQDVSAAFLQQAALENLGPMRRDFDRALGKTVQVCDQQAGSRKPVFIFAHSLGALITASYFLKNQGKQDGPAKRVSGVVFLGPGFAVSELPGWRGWLANPVIKLSFHAETHFLNPHDESFPLMAFNQLLAMIVVPILDGLFEMLSWPGIRNIATPSTPDWVVDYLTDSVEEKLRLQADGWIIRRSLMRYVKTIENEIVLLRRHMDEFNIPYYLIYSANDPLTAAWGSEDFIKATLENHADNQFRLLPQSRYHQHLFLAQPSRSILLDGIAQWMSKRIQAVTLID